MARRKGPSEDDLERARTEATPEWQAQQREIERQITANYGYPSNRDKPFYGSLGFNQPPPGSSETDRDLWRTEAQTDPSKSDWLTRDGQNFKRFGDPSQMGVPWDTTGVRNQLTYDDEYGYLLPQSAFEQWEAPIQAMNKADAKGAFMQWLGGAAGFLAPAMMANGAFSGLGIAGGEGVGALGSAFPVGAESGAWAGPGGAAGALAGGLPDSYWNMLAEGGGVANDAAPAAAGTVGQASPAFLNATDPVQAIAALHEIGGGVGATAGAQALGFDSVQAALASVNPSWVTPGLLSSLASGLGGARALGSLGAAGLGALGANQQTGALSDVADKYLSLGAPHRARLEQSYAPGFDLAKQDPAYQGAMDQSAQSVLRKLSATSGNPFDNPGALMEANKYVTQSTALPQLNTYRSQLGSFGGLGVNTAGTADLGSAQSSGGVYDALGYGLSSLTQDNSLDALLRKYASMNSAPINSGTRF